MNRIDAFRLRRRERLDAKASACDDVEKDGGPGSGNWNHVGRLNKRGGSAPAGTLGNFGKRAKDKYYKAGERSEKNHIVPDLKEVRGQINSKTGNVQNNTATMWTNENGDVNEKRQEVYDYVADHVLKTGASTKNQPSKKKVLTMYGGNSGAGKESLKKEKIKNSKAVRLGANQMKQQLGKAQEALGNTSKAQSHGQAALNFERESNQMHEEASALSKALFKEALEDGYEVAYDTEATSIDSIRDKINAARAAGYECNGEFVTTDLETSLKRLQTRWKSAKDKYEKALKSGKGVVGYPPQCPNFETVRMNYSHSVDTTVLTATDYDNFTLYDNSGDYADRHEIAKVVTDENGKKRLKLVGGDKERAELQKYLDGGTGVYTIDADGYVNIEQEPGSKPAKTAALPPDPTPLNTEPRKPKPPKKPKTPKPVSPPTAPTASATPPKPIGPKKILPEKSSLGDTITAGYYDRLDSLVDAIPEEGVKQTLVSAFIRSEVAHNPRVHVSRFVYSKFGGGINRVELKRTDGKPDNYTTEPDSAVPHECMHYLDYNYSGNLSPIPFSEKYNGGELRKTLDSELSAYLNSIGFRKSMGSIDTLNLFSKEQMRLNREGYSDVNLAPLSDMVQAVCGRRLTSAGHDDGYFYNLENRSTEAFAEMGAAYALNGKTKELLKKIVPKSCDVFERMCSELMKGGI